MTTPRFLGTFSVNRLASSDAISIFKQPDQRQPQDTPIMSGSEWIDFCIDTNV